MADSSTLVTVAGSGDAVDEEAISTGGTPATVKRQRMQLGGAALAEIARILNAAPAGTEYALVTRPIPSGVQTMQGQQDITRTGTITAATSVVGPFTATGYNLATIGITGTYAGVTAVFEGSPDGTNWFTLQGQQTDTGAVASGPVALTNTTRAWDIFVGAWTQFRLRATAWTSGTATILVSMQSMPTEPVPTVVQGPAAASSAPWMVRDVPVPALGFYSWEGSSGTYSSLAANTPLFSFRWGNATNLAVILKVEVMVVASVAATTAGLTERQLIIARSFTASDTGGTAAALTGNNQKLRTSFGTSLVTDLRAGAPLTAGTRTLDSAPISTSLSWTPLNYTGFNIGGSGAASTSAGWSGVGSQFVPLLDAVNGQDHPIVLAQNEGFVIRIGAIQPSGCTEQTYVRLRWAEVASF